MIIAGIYTRQKNIEPILKERLITSTKKNIKQDIAVLDNHFLIIIAGKTDKNVDQGQILKTQDTLLIGKIFSKKNYQKITQMDLVKISRKNNTDFVNNYWGNYLFIKSDGRQQTVTMLRDPVGQLPLFYTSYKNNIIFTSEINIIYDLLDKKPEMNWDYFCSFLLNTFITSEFTAFKNVYELPHGCELLLSKKTIKTSVAWNPLNYIHKNKNPIKTENLIIDTTSHVLKSWLESSQSIFLDLSGGLDSSSLLLILNSILNPEQKLHPITWYHPNVLSSDERKFAARVTQKIDTPLITLDMSKNLPLSSLNTKLGFRPNWPTSVLTHLKMEKHLGTLSKNYPQVTYVSGHGGDHIFLCPPPLAALVDYLIQKDPFSYSTKLKELAVYYRCSIFPLLKATYKGLLSYIFPINIPIEKNLNKETPWFSKELLALEKNVTAHPFFEQKQKIVPGKFQHITTIYQGLATIKGQIRNPYNPIFYPLFSQPLLELALSIPTYDTFAKGYDRYPLRKAISTTFKTNLVWRRDKGKTSGVMQRGIKKNLNKILELCLEGKIAQQKLINRKLLHQNIKILAAGHIDYQWPVTNLIAAELFFNYWK
ncbi:MAG: hypothetical protein JW855_01620 [Gammaproteobacteria bacterium]|nr:hypothetical protein [Gammaproteobacteria bacterium]